MYVTNDESPTLVVADPRECVADTDHQHHRREDKRQQSQRLYDAARPRYAEMQQQLGRQHEREGDHDRYRGEFE